VRFAGVHRSMEDKVTALHAKGFWSTIQAEIASHVSLCCGTTGVKMRRVVVVS
jgi:hypothetical protein